MTDTRLDRLCPKCGTANPATASFCHSCGKALDGRSSNLVDDLIRRGRGVLATPTGETVAKGLAVGAVAGAVLPFVTLPLGAIVGGAVAYARLKR